MKTALKSLALLIGVALTLMAVADSRGGRVHAQTHPSLSASASDGVVSIALSDYDSYDSGWWFRINGGTCTQVLGDAVSGIRGYPRTYAWTLSISAYSDGGCANVLDSATLDMPTISLSASASGAGASLTLSNYGMDWYYKIALSACAKADATTVSVPGYLSGSYSARAYRNSSDCLFDDNRLDETTFGSGPSPSLAASVSDGLISLTLSGYDHDWWFRIYKDAIWHGCERVSGASAEVRGYGKPRFWTTFIDVSSDSGCVSSIAFTHLNMPMTSLSASVNDEDEVSLTLSNFAGDWWHSIDGGDCVRATERTVGGITDYQDGAYTAKAYGSESDCGAGQNELGEATFSLPIPRLSASVSDGVVSIALSGALSDYDSGWWFRINNGICSQASGSTVSGIKGYSRTYAWTLSISAYSDGGCANVLDSATLDMPAINLSASVSDRKVDLTLSNYGMDWWFRINNGTCTEVSGNTVSGISGYQVGAHGAKAYKSWHDCNYDQHRLDDAAFSIAPPILSASATETGVSLTLSNYGMDWWYKIALSACSEADGPTVSVPGYLSGSYSAKAYKSGHDCIFDSNRLDETTFGSGPSPSLAASVSDGLISLTLSGYDHDWWFSVYQNGVWERCERVSGASAEVRGYGKPRFWTTFIDASSDSGCVSSIAYTHLDMPMTSLSASVNDANEVSLTLSNFAGDWWRSIDGGDCVRATERTVGGITDYQDGAHAAKAYGSESDCGAGQNELGEATFYLLVSRLSASTSGGKVDITLSNYDSGWWFRVENGSCSQAFGSTVSGISGYGQPNDWVMTIKAYSDGGCGVEIASATLDMPATALSASVSDGGKVDLTLSNFALGWWFRIGWGTCTSVSGDTVSGISGYQPGAYNAKAYANAGHCHADHLRLGETTFTIAP